VSPLALAGACAGAAFLIVAFIGGSIQSHDGESVPWFKTALGVGFAIFLLVLALILMPWGA
jgi:hypothetical protein